MTLQTARRVVPGQVGVGDVPPPLAIVLSETEAPAPRFAPVGTLLRLKAKFAVPPSAGGCRWTLMSGGEFEGEFELGLEEVFELEVADPPGIDRLHLRCEHVGGVVPGGPAEGEASAATAESEGEGEGDATPASPTPASPDPRVGEHLLSVYRLDLLPGELELITNEPCMLRARLEPQELEDLGGVFTLDLGDDPGDLTCDLLGCAKTRHRFPIRSTPEQLANHGNEDGRFERDEFLGCAGPLAGWVPVVRDDGTRAFAHMGNMTPATQQPEAGRRFDLLGTTEGTAELRLTYTPPESSGVPVLTRDLTVTVKPAPVRIQRVGGAAAPRWLRVGEWLSLEAVVSDTAEGELQWRVSQGAAAIALTGVAGPGDGWVPSSEVPLEALAPSSLDGARLECRLVPSDDDAAPFTASLTLTVYSFVITPPTTEAFVGERLPATVTLQPPELAGAGALTWGESASPPDQWLKTSRRASLYPGRSTAGPRLGRIPRHTYLAYDGEPNLPTWVPITWEGLSGFTHRANVTTVTSEAERARRRVVTATAAGVVEVTCTVTPEAGGETLSATPATFQFLPPHLELKSDTTASLPTHVGSGSALVIEAVMVPSSVDAALAGQGAFAWSVTDPQRLELITGLTLLRMLRLKHFYVEPNTGSRRLPSLRKDQVIAWKEEPGHPTWLRVFRGEDEGYFCIHGSMDDDAVVVADRTPDQRIAVRAKDDSPGPAQIEVSYSVGGETHTASHALSVLGLGIQLPDGTAPRPHLLVGETVTLRANATPAGAGGYSWTIVSGAEHVSVTGGLSGQELTLEGRAPLPTPAARVELQASFVPAGASAAIKARLELQVVKVAFKTDPLPRYLLVDETTTIEAGGAPGEVPGVYTWDPVSPANKATLVAGAGGAFELTGVEESQENEVVLTGRFQLTGSTFTVPFEHRLTVSRLRFLDVTTNPVDPPLVLAPDESYTFQPAATGEAGGQYSWGTRGPLQLTSPAQGPTASFSVTGPSQQENDAVVECTLTRADGQTTQAEHRMTVVELSIVLAEEAPGPGGDAPDTSEPQEIEWGHSATLKLLATPAVFHDATYDWTVDPSTLLNFQSGSAANETNATPNQLQQGTIRCALTSAAQRTYRAERPLVVTTDDYNEQVLVTAYDFTEEGHNGYNNRPGVGGTGVPEDITYSNATGSKTWEAPPTDTTYCSGFTFAVFMKTALETGVIGAQPLSQIRSFASQWYGAGSDLEYQSVRALEDLGVGVIVDEDAAKAGDFCQYFRRDSDAPDKWNGHSVIFLGWKTDAEGNRIGIRYRSSNSGGIGDSSEKFKGHYRNRPNKGIRRDRIHFGRLTGSQ